MTVVGTETVGQIGGRGGKMGLISGQCSGCGLGGCPVGTPCIGGGVLVGVVSGYLSVGIGLAGGWFVVARLECPLIHERRKKNENPALSPQPRRVGKLARGFLLCRGNINISAKCRSINSSVISIYNCSTLLSVANSAKGWIGDTWNAEYRNRFIAVVRD